MLEVVVFIPIVLSVALCGSDRTGPEWIWNRVGQGDPGTLAPRFEFGSYGME